MVGVAAKLFNSSATVEVLNGMGPDINLCQSSSSLSLSEHSFTLANVKREVSDLDWCESSGAEDYCEEDFRMVETSAPQAAVLPQHFMFLNQMNEGFKPVYRKSGPPATPSTPSGSSLFTIDSILSRPRAATATSIPRPPVFQTGQPAGFNFGHIAAASAGFGTTSAEFLGESVSVAYGSLF